VFVKVRSLSDGTSGRRGCAGASAESPCK
jgi:hypothetical protein